MSRLALLVVAACMIVSPALAGQAVDKAPDPATDPAPVIAAERAFAADGLTTGVDASFLKWSAPEAVMISGGRVNRAHAVLDPNATFDPAAPSLVWWPNLAGIARSGDLGFTTGGVEVGGTRRGHYFTIWKRQSDGGWKWIYDGGTGASAADVPGPDSPPDILAATDQGSTSADAAMIEVRAAEAALSMAAATNQKRAHMAALAPDGRIYVSPLPPAIGASAYAVALDRWPTTFDFSAPAGGTASASGDLAWDYGQAHWIEAHTEAEVRTREEVRVGLSRSGWYVHLWRKDAPGWRLVFTQLLPDPPATPPPPPAGG